jgi:C2 domain
VTVLLSPFRNDSIGKEWKEHRSFKLEEISVLHSGAASLAHPGGARVLEVKMGFGAQTVTRDLKFDTAEDAAGFERLLNKLRDREKARAQRKVAQYKINRQHKLEAAAATAKSGDKGGSKGFLRFAATETSEAGSELASGTGDATESSEKVGVDGDEIRLLVEIVSATDLPVADISSTDAYVVVLMGGREMHKTRVVSKTLDPIWTLRTGSLCLITMTPEEFFSCSSGMTLLIKDYDAVGANDVLGQVVISLDELLESKGERVGYDVVLEKNFRQSLRDPLKKTKLYLRIKEASHDDVEVRVLGCVALKSVLILVLTLLLCCVRKFIREFQSDPKRLGVYAGETFLPIVPPSQSLLKRQVKRDHQTTMVRTQDYLNDPFM